ncbi:HeH/LEM domain-containing protein [Acinetobacter haemolyticus]|uniref:HeH/LEM domain-containing protein n=1 Tax=Acinetobacter haemolyticus TaxID=29430 RepID=UPI003C23C30C
MGLSSFNRMRERQMLNKEISELATQINALETQFVTVCASLTSLQSSVAALDSRIAELEPSEENQNPVDGGNHQAQDHHESGTDQQQNEVLAKPENDQQAGGDNQDENEPVDYSSLKVDEIKAVLTEKGISFDGVTRKDDLLALIPQESKE